MNKLRLWRTALSERIQKLNLKKKIVLILCILLLILPSVFALIYVYHTDHLQKTDLFSVSLYDSNGTLLGSDEGPPDHLRTDSLAGIFYRLTTKKKQANLGGTASDGDPYLRAVIQSNGIKEELICYFSFVAAGGYCTDSKGIYYTIPSDVNEQFLLTSYAEPLYSNAVAPKLFTIDNEAVLPSAVRWNYKNYGGIYESASGNITTAEPLLYDMTGEIGIWFETEPTSCIVQIFDGDQRIYNGSHRNLASQTFDSGNELHIKVRATWNHSADLPFYGELQYDFLTMIRNRSVFTLNTEAVTAGDFALLSCTNITTLSKISFQTDSELPAPVFYQDGDMARALLVFPDDTTVTEYSFRISYGASAKSFTVTVTPAASPEELLLPSIEENALSSDQVQQAWQSLLHAVEPQGTSGVYFRGNFHDPSLSGFRIGYSHGATVKANVNDPGVRALGTEYITEELTDQPVSALMNGMVISVGNDKLLGTYVIVDHGCGLRSWYGHLSDTDVEVGQVVAKGDSVGKTGRTGWASDNGFLLVCTIYDTVISPDTIVGKEIPLS